MTDRGSGPIAYGRRQYVDGLSGIALTTQLLDEDIRQLPQTWQEITCSQMYVIDGLDARGGGSALMCHLVS